MLSLILEYRDEAQSIVAVLAGLAVLKWGGGPERALALVWLLLFEGVHRGYHLFWHSPFQLNRLDAFHMSIDFGAMAIFVVIALNANRMYPLWIAALQLVAFSAHLARDLTDAITPIAYAVMVISPSYLQLGLMAGGLALHLKRNRQFGPYRDWRQGDRSNALQRRLSTFGREA